MAGSIPAKGANFISLFQSSLVVKQGAVNAKTVGSNPTFGANTKENDMQVAVIIEASYDLYDQHYERSIWDVVVQHDGEEDEQFYSRVEKVVSGLKSTYSYYDYECFSYYQD